MALPPFSAFRNVAGPLRRAQVGASLSLKGLLHIAEVLRTVGASASGGGSAKLWAASFPSFSALLPAGGGGGRPLPPLSSAKDTLADNASRDLQEIRRKITNAGASCPPCAG